jgi:histidyl-tRNA synthetase
VIIAQQELDQHMISIKDMQNGEQKNVPQDWLADSANFLGQ